MSYIIDSKIQSQTIFLSSHRAKSRSPFKFDLSNAITVPLNMKILLSVEEFVISNCFNNVTIYNNKIAFTCSTHGYFQVELTPNIYNTTSFITSINLLLLPYDIVAVYNQKQFKISFVSVYMFQLEESTCAQLIGVGKNNQNTYEYPLYASSDPAFTLYMPSCVDFSGSSYIFLKSDDVITSNINSVGVINNTLCRIPINSPYGYKIFYRPTESTKILISNNNIQSLTFSFEDMNNNEVDIRSTEFQLLIKISYIYTPIEKSNLIEGTIDYHLAQMKMNTIDEEEVDNTLE